MSDGIILRIPTNFTQRLVHKSFREATFLTMHEELPLPPPCVRQLESCAYQYYHYTVLTSCHSIGVWPAITTTTITTNISVQTAAAAGPSLRDRQLEAASSHGCVIEVGFPVGTADDVASLNQSIDVPVASLRACDPKLLPAQPTTKVRNHSAHSHTPGNKPAQVQHSHSACSTLSPQHKHHSCSSDS